MGVACGATIPGTLGGTLATVSLPLFASTRQDPIIDARLESANGVRIDREAARRALVAQLDSDLADHAMHHDRLHRALDTLVPLAKRRADLETASYGAGTASLSASTPSTAKPMSPATAPVSS